MNIARVRAAAAGVLFLTSSALLRAQSSMEDSFQSAGGLIQQARLIGTQSSARVDAPASPALSYASVCGADSAALKNAREKRREAGLAAIMPEIKPRFEALIKKYGLPTPAQDNFVNSALNSVTYTYSYKTDVAKAALADFAEVIEDAVLKRIPMPDYARIKANLIAQVQKDPGLSSDAKNELTRRIELTELVLPSRYIRDYITTTDDLWPVIPQITEDQAWNASYDDLGGADNPKLAKDQSAVIVYMGLLLAEIRDGQPLAHLDFVLSHETSHSIDSGRLPSLYDGYIGCMKQRYQTDFKGWDEVLADHWAVEALVPLLTQQAPAQRMDYLRKSFEIICDTSGEAGSIIIGMIKADHPSGQYRIESILGGNPDILKALGLSTSASQAPFCRP